MTSHPNLDQLSEGHSHATADATGSEIDQLLPHRWTPGLPKTLKNDEKGILNFKELTHLHGIGVSALFKREKVS
jgi:hypothetical protein